MNMISHKTSSMHGMLVFAHHSSVRHPLLPAQMGHLLPQIPSELQTEPSISDDSMSKWMYCNCLVRYSSYNIILRIEYYE